MTTSYEVLAVRYATRRDAGAKSELDFRYGSYGERMFVSVERH